MAWPLVVSARSEGRVGPRAALITAAAAFLSLMVLAAIANRNLLTFDRPVQEAVMELSGEVGLAMEWIGRAGSRFVLAPITLALAAVTWRRCRQLAAMFLIAFVAAIGLELALKAVVGRPRPMPDVGFGDSFPSGHVVAAVSFLGLLPLWARIMSGKPQRWLWPAIGTIVALVGVSRIYLSAHWPSDVIGGVLLGAIFVAVATAAVQRPWRVLQCERCTVHGPAES
jgi:undecaprenyl-diphosphatase